MKVIKKNQIIALAILIAFITTNFQLPESWAAQQPAAVSGLNLKASLPLEVSRIQIPKEMGRIEEFFKGNTSQTVLILQDAHAIPEAQRNLQKLIERFQNQYGVAITGLEGAAEDLDTEVFRSFPDTKRLHELFESFFDKGEMTGGTAAAVFGHEHAVYAGVEDWPLYEQGLELYLGSVKNQVNNGTALTDWNKDLSEREQKVFSPELLKVTEALRNFEQNHADLAVILKALAALRAPDAGSQLEAMLKAMSREGSDQNNDDEGQVGAIAEKIKADRNQAALTSKQKKEFSGQYQAFQTGQISVQAFALFLKEFIQTQKPVLPMASSVGALQSRLPLPEKDKSVMRDVLTRIVGDQKKIRDMEGTKFLDEFERYVMQVKEFLYRSDAERALDQEGAMLALFEKLNKLELSRKEWQQLKSWIVGWQSQEAVLRRAGTEIPLLEGVRPVEGRTGVVFSDDKTRVSVLSASQNWADSSSKTGLGLLRSLVTRSESLRTLNLELPAMFKTHFDFYENAQKRDEAFLKNLLRRMNSGTPQHSAMLVVGGFHAQGLMQRLKEKGISYALVMPHLNGVPEKTAYADEMQGRVSWRSYFNVENGKVSVYKAFVRYVRDQLLGVSSSPLDLPPKSLASQSLVGALQNRHESPLWKTASVESRNPMLLKNWRDAVLRNLAKKNQLEKAAQYTHFFDELTDSVKNKTENVSFSKADHFFEELRTLVSGGRLTTQSFYELLKSVQDGAGLRGIPTATVVAGAVSTTLAAKSEMRASLLGLIPPVDNSRMPRGKYLPLSQSMGTGRFVSFPLDQQVPMRGGRLSDEMDLAIGADLDGLNDVSVENQRNREEIFSRIESTLLTSPDQEKRYEAFVTLINVKEDRRALADWKFDERRTELLRHALFDPYGKIRRFVGVVIGPGSVAKLDLNLFLTWLKQADQYLPPGGDSLVDPRMPAKSYSPLLQREFGKEAILWALAEHMHFEPWQSNFLPVFNQALEEEREILKAGRPGAESQAPISVSLRRMLARIVTRHPDILVEGLLKNSSQYGFQAQILERLLPFVPNANDPLTAWVYAPVLARASRSEMRATLLGLAQKVPASAGGDVSGGFQFRSPKGPAGRAQSELRAIQMAWGASFRSALALGGKRAAEIVKNMASITAPIDRMNPLYRMKNPLARANTNVSLHVSNNVREITSLRSLVKKLFIVNPLSLVEIIKALYKIVNLFFIKTNILFTPTKVALSQERRASSQPAKERALPSAKSEMRSPEPSTPGTGIEKYLDRFKNQTLLRNDRIRAANKIGNVLRNLERKKNPLYERTRAQVMLELVALYNQPAIDIAGLRGVLIEQIAEFGIPLDQSRALLLAVLTNSETPAVVLVEGVAALERRLSSAAFESLPEDIFTALTQLLLHANRSVLIWTLGYFKSLIRVVGARPQLLTAFESSELEKIKRAIPGLKQKADTRPQSEFSRAELYQIYLDIREQKQSSQELLADLFKEHRVVLMGTHNFAGRSFSQNLVDDMNHLAENGWLTHLILPLPEKFSDLFLKAIEAGNATELFKALQSAVDLSLFGLRSTPEEVSRFIHLIRQLSPEITIEFYPEALMDAGESGKVQLAIKIRDLLAQNPKARLLLYSDHNDTVRKTSEEQAQPGLLASKLLLMLDARTRRQVAFVTEETKTEWQMGGSTIGHNLRELLDLGHIPGFGLQLSDSATLGERVLDGRNPTPLREAVDALIFRTADSGNDDDSEMPEIFPPAHTLPLPIFAPGIKSGYRSEVRVDVDVLEEWRRNLRNPEELVRLIGNIQPDLTTQQFRRAVREFFPDAVDSPELFLSALLTEVMFRTPGKRQAIGDLERILTDLRWGRFKAMGRAYLTLHAWVKKPGYLNAEAYAKIRPPLLVQMILGALIGFLLSRVWVSLVKNLDAFRASVFGIGAGMLVAIMCNYEQTFGWLFAVLLNDPGDITKDPSDLSPAFLDDVDRLLFSQDFESVDSLELGRALTAGLEKFGIKPDERETKRRAFYLLHSMQSALWLRQAQSSKDNRKEIENVFSEKYESVYRLIARTLGAKNIREHTVFRKLFPKDILKSELSKEAAKRAGPGARSEVRTARFVPQESGFEIVQNAASAREKSLADIQKTLLALIQRIVSEGRRDDPLLAIQENLAGIGWIQLDEPIFDRLDVILRGLLSAHPGQEGETYLEDILQTWFQKSPKDIGEIQNIHIERLSGKSQQTELKGQQHRLVVKIEVVFKDKSRAVFSATTDADKKGGTTPEYENLKTIRKYPERSPVQELLGYVSPARGGPVLFKSYVEGPTVLAELRKTRRQYKTPTMQESEFEKTAVLLGETLGRLYARLSVIPGDLDNLENIVVSRVDRESPLAVVIDLEGDVTGKVMRDSSRVHMPMLMRDALSDGDLLFRLSAYRLLKILGRFYLNTGNLKSVTPFLDALRKNLAMGLGDQGLADEKLRNVLQAAQEIKSGSDDFYKYTLQPQAQKVKRAMARWAAIRGFRSEVRSVSEFISGKEIQQAVSYRAGVQRMLARAVRTSRDDSSFKEVDSHQRGRDAVKTTINRFTEAVQTASETMRTKVLGENIISNIRGNIAHAKIAVESVGAGKVLVTTLIPTVETEAMGILIFSFSDLNEREHPETEHFIGYVMYGRQPDSVVQVGFDIFPAYRRDENGHRAADFEPGIIFKTALALLADEFKPQRFILNTEEQIAKSKMGNATKNAVFYLRQGFYPEAAQREADELLARVLRPKKALLSAEDTAGLLSSSFEPLWILPINPVRLEVRQTPADSYFELVKKPQQQAERNDLIFEIEGAPDSPGLKDLRVVMLRSIILYGQIPDPHYFLLTFDRNDGRLLAKASLAFRRAEDGEYEVRAPDLEAVVPGKGSMARTIELLLKTGVIGRWYSAGHRSGDAIPMYDRLELRGLWVTEVGEHGDTLKLVKLPLGVRPTGNFKAFSLSEVTRSEVRSQKQEPQTMDEADARRAIADLRKGKSREVERLIEIIVANEQDDFYSGMSAALFKINLERRVRLALANVYGLTPSSLSNPRDGWPLFIVPEGSYLLGSAYWVNSLNTAEVVQISTFDGKGMVADFLAKRFEKNSPNRKAMLTFLANFVDAAYFNAESAPLQERRASRRPQEGQASPNSPEARSEMRSPEPGTPGTPGTGTEMRKEKSRGLFEGQVAVHMGQLSGGDAAGRIKNFDSKKAAVFSHVQNNAFFNLNRLFNFSGLKAYVKGIRFGVIIDFHNLFSLLPISGNQENIIFLVRINNFQQSIIELFFGQSPLSETVNGIIGIGDGLLDLFASHRPFAYSLEDMFRILIRHAKHIIELFLKINKKMILLNDPRVLKGGPNGSPEKRALPAPTRSEMRASTEGDKVTEALFEAWGLFEPLRNAAGNSAFAQAMAQLQNEPGTSSTGTEEMRSEMRSLFSRREFLKTALSAAAASTLEGSPAAIVNAAQSVVGNHAVVKKVSLTVRTVEGWEARWNALNEIRMMGSLRGKPVAHAELLERLEITDVSEWAGLIPTDDLPAPYQKTYRGHVQALVRAIRFSEFIGRLSAERGYGKELLASVETGLNQKELDPGTGNPVRMSVMTADRSAGLSGKTRPMAEFLYEHFSGVDGWEKLFESDEAMDLLLNNFIKIIGRNKEMRRDLEKYRAKRKTREFKREELEKALHKKKVALEVLEDYRRGLLNFAGFRDPRTLLDELDDAKAELTKEIRADSTALAKLTAESQSRQGMESAVARRSAKSEMRAVPHPKANESIIEAQQALAKLGPALAKYLFEREPVTDAELRAWAEQGTLVVRQLGESEFEAFVREQMAMSQRTQNDTNAVSVPGTVQVSPQIADFSMQRVLKNFSATRPANTPDLSVTLGFDLAGEEPALKQVLGQPVVQSLVERGLISQEMDMSVLRSVKGINLSTFNAPRFGNQRNMGTDNPFVFILTHAKQKLGIKKFAAALERTNGAAAGNLDKETFFNGVSDLVEILAGAVASGVKEIASAEDLKNPLNQSKIKAELLRRLFASDLEASELKESAKRQLFKFEQDENGISLQVDRSILFRIITEVYAKQAVSSAA